MIKKIWLLATIGLWSCQSSVTQTEKKSVETTVTVIDSAPAMVSPIPEIPAEDLVFIPAISDSFSKNVLIESNYHGDEVWNGATKQKWYGLFQDKKGYYIAKTKLIQRIVDDLIVDKEGETTGKEISTSNTDTSMVLLSKIALKEGRIEEAKIDWAKHKEIQKIEPEWIKKGTFTPFILSVSDKLAFSFKNKPYLLTAKHKVTNKDTSGYELNLSVGEGSAKQEQLIISYPRVEYPEMTINWLGDIDSDGKLDLVLTDGTRENTSIVLVFLSSQAKQGELVHYFGAIVEVGC